MKQDKGTQGSGPKQDKKDHDGGLDENGLRIEVSIRITRGGVGIVEEASNSSEINGVLGRHRIQDAFRTLHEIGTMHFNSLYKPAINELLRNEIEALKEKDRRQGKRTAAEAR